MNVIEVVKASQSEHTIQWAKETNCTNDELFVESNGAPTFAIAEILGVTVLKARQTLNKAHKEGLICKSKNNGGKYCNWWPVGYLNELKEGK